MRRFVAFAAVMGVVALACPHDSSALFTDFFKRAGRAISDGVRKAGDAISDVADKVGRAVKDVANKAGAFGQDLIDKAKTAGDSIKKWVEAAGKKVDLVTRNIMPQFPEHRIKLRLPLEKPSEFDGRVIWHLDTLLGKLGSFLCRNYRGHWGVLSCYGGHNGTDYRLKNGFTAMDRGLGWIVAAAGKVVKVQDGNFDRCNALDVGAFIRNRTVGVMCQGKPRSQNYAVYPPNYVTVEHAPDLRTQYYHFRKSSIVVREGQTVRCGDRLGTAGSSGESSFPHLHFMVERKNSAGKWVPVDPYRGQYSQGYSYWTGQRDSPDLPSTACQR